MKIAIVTPYALPEKGAASMRVDSFYNYFKEKGHKVQLIVPFRKCNGGKNIKRYKNISELIAFIRGNDVVLVTTPPIKTALLLLHFIKFLKIPLVVDVRDLAEKGKYKKIKRGMERYVLKKAEKVTVVTPYLKDYFAKHYMINKSKIKFISNGVDTSIFYPKKIDSKKIGIQLGIPKNAKTVIYEGIIGDHELDIFLRLMDAELLKKYNIYIILVLIVGETERKSKILLKNLKNSARKRRIIKRLKIIQNLNPKEMSAYISTADFGLAPIPSTIDNLYRIPIKAYEYLACEVPLLGKGPRGGELEKLVKQNKAGIFAASWSELKEKFIKHLKFKKEIKVSRKIAQKFERKKFAKKMLSCLLEFKK
jgi:glycosyltransferase involved in cell wall biosynthesis